MRIGIDVRYLSHGLVGGVHTYVANLVPALLELAGEHQIYLYADSKRPLELNRLPCNATIRTLPWHGPASTVWQDFTLRRSMARDRLDVAHFPANYGFGPRGVPGVLTLHDSINVLPLLEIVRGHRKDARTLAMMTYLHLCTTAAVRRAALVLTVSGHAASDIARRAHIARERIVPIPHAPTADLQRVTDPAVLGSVRERHDLVGRFVLADALKNPAVLIRAWRMLPLEIRQDRQIVFFSRRPDLLPIVHKAVYAGEARLLVRVSRPDLIALYSMAEAFVFPSWVEGFGIPVLEAMTCGAPVIASDRGAIPEVLGGAGVLVDAEDAPGLAARLTEVLTNPSIADGMRERGFARASQFSWCATGQQTLAAYSRAATLDD